MKRLGNSWISILTYSARIGALLIVVNMVACSGSSRTPVNNTGFDTSGDNQDLFSDNSTTTDGGVTFNESLFDQELGTDPTSGVNELGQATSTEQQCLTQDQNLFNIGTGQNTNNPGCFQSLQQNGQNGQMSSFFNAFQQDQLPQFMMNTATTSYGLSDRCVQMAMMVPQFYGAQQNADWNEIFRIAKTGLVRCVRQINQWQGASVPWGGQQQNVFGYNDNNLWRLMVSFDSHN